MSAPRHNSGIAELIIVAGGLALIAAIVVQLFAYSYHEARDASSKSAALAAARQAVEDFAADPYARGTETESRDGGLTLVIRTSAQAHSRGTYYSIQVTAAQGAAEPVTLSSGSYRPEAAK